MKPTIQLNPALKSWLDNAIIPALLREYLRELRVRMGKEVLESMSTELAQNARAEGQA